MTERSLFRRLQTLSASEEREQTEDFFTEALAGLFEHQPGICRAWLLGSIPGLQISEEARLFVSTQVRYEKLETTSHGRRPDMRIICYEPRDGRRSVILIESKHGAPEGDRQLKDYARILHREHPAARVRLLLYITTRYRNVLREDVLGELPTGSVELFKLRWHDFYRFLKSRRPAENRDYYRRQLLRYMEELGMATANQFEPEDIITLRTLPRTIKLMEEVLDGAVADEFYGLLGSSSTTLSDQLRTKGRFVLKKMCRHVQVVLGFYLREPHEYPSLRLIVEVEPDSIGESQIFDAMDQVQSASDWQSKSLDTRSNWSGILKERSLRAFMNEPDHVKALKRECMEMIATIRQLKGAHPGWFDKASEGKAVEDLA